MWALAFAAASVLLTGYRVYYHNQALQLPLVNLLNDPTLYPNDPFARTLPYYASHTWRLVALCTRLIPLEPLLLALFLATRLLIVYAAGNLALAFAPKCRPAMLLAMALIASDPVPILGGGTILMPYFEQTSLAAGLLMMAMAAFHRGRPYACALWLAAGFACNSMYGVYAMTYIAAAALAAIAENGKRRSDIAVPPRRSWVTAAGLFALLSIPTVALSAAAVGANHVSADLWFSACRARVPHHIFPSTWQWVKYARFALLAGTVTLGLAASRSSTLRISGAAWTLVSVLWLSAAIAAEQLHLPTVMILQAARATDLWYCFGAIALIAACFSARRGWALAALALVPFVLLHPGGRGAAHIEDGTWTLYGTPGKSMQQICRWARANTGRKDCFLINPNWAQFRGISQRSAFVTWKDGSALLWRRDFAAPWSERIRALGYDVTGGEPDNCEAGARLDRLYESMSDSHACSLAARYGLRYWVVRVEHQSALPVVYANAHFKVICLHG